MPDSKKSQAHEHADNRLEDLAAHFRGPLRAFLRKRLPPGTDPDDYVQEVFLRLARRADLADVDNLEGYIFQIAVNLVRDDRRRASTSNRMAHVEFNESFHGYQFLSPERVLIGKDDVNALVKALEKLPERTRHVFVLRRFEGLRYGEIAQRLGVSVSSVEKHMVRAIASIDDLLGARK
ncbi:MAG: sigma-70 family RNA polymerase sigma factor [Oceanicaulis sp.]|nr:sigma-70 family RNA polymerase sigma factor [Oceanicaulis sp.]